MERAVAVIGAAFGDEGKGRMVDYFCSQLGADTLVVRFNGGAQAGHTVVTPDGRRHVFRHYGAGGLLGCPTYLSKHFIANPCAWPDEFRELGHLFDVNGPDQIDKLPKLYLDGESLLTTPYDCFINDAIEKARGSGRHGSCGMGVHETIVRCEDGRVATRVSDILDPHALKEKLRRIRGEWMPSRIIALGLEAKLTDEFVEAWHSDAVLSRYLVDAQAMLKYSSGIGDAGLINEARNVVFEGAQGLLLDRDRSDFFPHLTPSNTGLKNVVQIIDEMGIPQWMIEPVYCLRSYMTRHGAGPFPSEYVAGLGAEFAAKTVDKTNRENEWQGRLRYGWLDFTLIQQAIAADLRHLTYASPRKHKIAMGHLDEKPAHFPTIRAQLGMIDYGSIGPTRDDVAEWAQQEKYRA